MLSDLMLLEIYYGSGAAALYLEELSLRYGAPAIQKAMRAGEIITRKILLGPDCGRLLVALTDKGLNRDGEAT